MDFNPVWNKQKIKFNHNEQIPESFRMLIIGPSGCGKTVLLLKMLLIPRFLDYNNLIVFSKTIKQPEYQLIYHGFKKGLSKESIISIFKNQDKVSGEIEEIIDRYSEAYPENNDISVTMNDKLEEIPAPQNLDSSRKNLIIFDDCVNLKNQNVMESYYTRGRHQSCNCIYLSQSWFELPGRSIRGNSNFIVLFKLNKRNRDQLYSDLFSNIIDKQEFDCISWKNKYKYLVLNKEKEEIIYDDIF